MRAPKTGGGTDSVAAAKKRAEIKCCGEKSVCEGERACAYGKKEVSSKRLALFYMRMCASKSVSL